MRDVRELAKHNQLARLPIYVVFSIGLRKKHWFSQHSLHLAWTQHNLLNSTTKHVYQMQESLIDVEELSESNTGLNYYNIVMNVSKTGFLAKALVTRNMAMPWNQVFMPRLHYIS